MPEKWGLILREKDPHHSTGVRAVPLGHTVSMEWPPTLHGYAERSSRKRESIEGETTGQGYQLDREEEWQARLSLGLGAQDAPLSWEMTPEKFTGFASRDAEPHMPAVIVSYHGQGLVTME